MQESPRSAEQSAGDKPAAHDAPALRPVLAWSIMLALGLAIWLCSLLFQQPDGKVPPWGWRLLAVFVPTILGLMLRPLPGGAVVLLAVAITIAVDALPPAPPDLSDSRRDTWPYEKALGGYADPTVWLVLAAYFLARGLIKTGLARRIALLFVRRLGRSTLGLSYAVVASNTILAGMIPSNAARVGGVTLPVTRSLAELYKSYPGRTAGMLGTFLMLTLYQADVIACALFFTGQASNPLAASQAAQLTQNVPGGPVQLHYANWFLYALAPALVSLALVPWLIYRLCRPEITHTPEATEMARRELDALGATSFGERVMATVFVGVCLGWIVTGFLFGSRYTTLVALAGVGVLFLSGVLTWEDAVSERGAWDVFLWYGGLVQLGKLLNESQVIKLFADSIASGLSFLNLALLFVLVLLIYFYAHYGFASITVHILSIYPAFVGVLLDSGASPKLVTCVFAYFANLSAGLTHYGTTHAPIIFGTGYVSHREWWRIGFLISLVNVFVWLAVGLPWWWLWGLW